MNPPVLIFGFSDESPFIAELVAGRSDRLHRPVEPVRPEPATRLLLASAFKYENISSQSLSQMLA